MEEQPTSYKHLRPEERATIASPRLQNAGVRETARTLGRPASTISRELRHNASPQVGYASGTAQTLHAARRQAARPAPRLDVRSVLRSAALALLSRKGSLLESSQDRTIPDDAIVVGIDTAVAASDL